MGRGWVAAIAALAFAALAIPGSAAAAPGDLDPSFSGDGKHTADFGGDEAGEGLAIAPDGSVYVAAAPLSGQSSADQFRMLGLTAAGAPSTRLAPDGKRVFGFAENTIDQSRAVAAQADGRVVLAGNSNASPSGGGSSGNQNYAIARLLSNGNFDPTFNSSGFAITDIAGQDQLNDLVIDPEGRIVAVGTSGSDISIVRYMPDGTLDASFSDDGKLTVDLGGTESANGVALAPDGGIVIGGHTTAAPITGSSDMLLVRISSAGEPDAAFGASGALRLDFAGNEMGNDVAIGSDGRIVVAGAVRNTASKEDLAVGRVLAGGGLDPSFSGDGKAVHELGGDEVDRAHGIALTPGSKVVIVGERRPLGGSFQFFVGQLLADGSIDDDFGAGGLSIVDFAGAEAAGRGSVVLNPEGDILASGTGSATLADTDVAIAKLEGDPLDLDTRIDAGPPTDETLTDNDVEFSFSSPSLGVVGFECALGNESFAACASPIQRTSVADGQHTFQVRAFNSLGARDPSPATRTFTIDTTAPWLQIKRKKLKLDRKGRAAVKVRCSFERSGPCVGRIVVKTVGKFDLSTERADRPVAAKRSKRKSKTVRLAVRKYSLDADGKARKLKLKLKGRKKLRLIRNNRQARRVSVVVRVRDQVGNKDRVVKEMKIVPAKRKRGKRR